MDDHKARLRTALRRARRQLAAADRQAEEVATVAALQAWCQTDGITKVASYAACGGELRLDAFHVWCWSHGVAVFLPKVLEPGRMAWGVVAGPDDCSPGAYGISEPAEHVALINDLPIAVPCLAPGVGFGPDGVRLGQGGGFYDRFMVADRLTIGIAFTCQWREDLPVADHDRPVQRLLCGGAWRYFGKERTRV